MPCRRGGGGDEVTSLIYSSLSRQTSCQHAMPCLRGGGAEVTSPGLYASGILARPGFRPVGSGCSLACVARPRPGDALVAWRAFESAGRRLNLGWGPHRPQTPPTAHPPIPVEAPTLRHLAAMGSETRIQDTSLSGPHSNETYHILCCFSGLRASRRPDSPPASPSPAQGAPPRPTPRRAARPRFAARRPRVARERLAEPERPGAASLVVAVRRVSLASLTRRPARPSRHSWGTPSPMPSARSARPGTRKHGALGDRASAVLRRRRRRQTAGAVAMRLTTSALLL